MSDSNILSPKNTRHHGRLTVTVLHTMSD